jgi:hypothetical protein
METAGEVDMRALSIGIPISLALWTIIIWLVIWWMT